jgi:hypothetical protein
VPEQPATPAPFRLIQRPLQAQIRALNVAVRGSAAERAWQHASNAVALINEVTDLALTADDLLRGLLEGAETGLNGQDVLDALLELGVQRRLMARGTLVERDGVKHFTRDDDALREEVRELLGDRGGDLLDDPRWRMLLDGP